MFTDDVMNTRDGDAAILGLFREWIAACAASDQVSKAHPEDPLAELELGISVIEGAPIVVRCIRDAVRCCPELAPFCAAFLDEEAKS